MDVRSARSKWVKPATSASVLACSSPCSWLSASKFISAGCGTPCRALSASSANQFGVFSGECRCAAKTPQSEKHGAVSDARPAHTPNFLPLFLLQLVGSKTWHSAHLVLGPVGRARAQQALYLLPMCACSFPCGQRGPCGSVATIIGYTAQIPGVSDRMTTQNDISQIVCRVFHFISSWQPWYEHLIAKERTRIRYHMLFECGCQGLRWIRAHNHSFPVN